MKNKLFYLACCFVFMWTLGQVFDSSYSENLIYCLSMTLACAIWLGIHSDVKKAILTKFHKAHP